MDFDLRLAGRRTVAFRCGCFFARGDDIGIAGWRLCGRHADRAIAVEVAFGTDCVVICPLDVEHVGEVEETSPAYVAEAERS